MVVELAPVLRRVDLDCTPVDLLMGGGGDLLASSYCTVIKFNIISSLGLEGLACRYDN
jgi:hypothetical protein